MNARLAALAIGSALLAALTSCGPSENAMRHFGPEETGSDEALSVKPLWQPPIAGLRPPLAPGSEKEEQVSAPPGDLTERLLAAPSQGGAIIKRGGTSWLGSLF